MQDYYCILTPCYRLLVAMVYYPWAVGSDLPGLRLAVGFIGVQSFPAVSRLHQLGAVSVPGAAPAEYWRTEAPDGELANSYG